MSPFLERVQIHYLCQGKCKRRDPKRDLACDAFWIGPEKAQGELWVRFCPHIVGHLRLYSGFQRTQRPPETYPTSPQTGEQDKMYVVLFVHSSNSACPLAFFILFL